MRYFIKKNYYFGGRPFSKGFAILVVFLFCGMTLYAQMCTSSQFVRNYGFEGIGSGHFLDRLPSGEIYFGGSKNERLVLHKNDKYGQPLWNKQYIIDEPQISVQFNLATMDSSGNYFVNLGGNGIGLLDGDGIPLRALKLQSPKLGFYGTCIGVLADNKKVLLLNSQIDHQPLLVCFTEDLSSIVWAKHFTEFNVFREFLIVGNKIFGVGSGYSANGMLMVFDGTNGHVITQKSFLINNEYNTLWKMFAYNGGYILQTNILRDFTTGIYRLDKDLNVINAYTLPDITVEYPPPALNTDTKGNLYGAWNGLGTYRFAINRQDELLWNRHSVNTAGYNPQIIKITPEGINLLSSFHWYNNSDKIWESRIGLSRSDHAGIFGECPSQNSRLRIEPATFTINPLALVPEDFISELSLLTVSIEVSEDVTHSVVTCQTTSTCTSLEIIGTKDLCNINTAIFIGRRNEHCFTPVIWKISGGEVIQTTINDSMISLQFSESGDYMLIASISTCETISDTINVRVTMSDHELDLGADTTLCPRTSITLNAGSEFYSYLWQDGSAKSDFVVMEPGLYHVQTTDACGEIYRDTILVAGYPPFIFDAGPDRVKCEQDTLHLSATSGFLSYEWFPDYNANSINEEKIVVNPLTDTFYTVKAEMIPGCFAFDTVYIKVNRTLPLDLGPDVDFCTGDSIRFNAGDAFVSYTWSNQTTQPFITVKEAGVYSVEAVSAEGCVSLDTVKVVNVFSNPIINLDKNPVLCAGESRLLDAGKFASYTWNDGSNKSRLSAVSEGIYFVEVTDKNGCRASDTTMITALSPLPSGFLPKDTSICSFESILLEAATGYQTYSWSDNSMTSSTTVNRPGTYRLRVTDEHHCVGEESIRVTSAECLEGVYIPNAFTPNNDGRNDLFKPMVFGKLQNYHLIVYNRFGQKVFETGDASRGWNGSKNGVPTSKGIYVWICTYQFAGSNVETKKGTVTLLR